MRVARYAAAAMAAGMLAAQPCAAAEDLRDQSGQERQASAFGGVSVRVPLGRTAGAKPSARLRLTTGYSVRDRLTGASRSFRGHGLELGAGTAGKPTLYLGGQNSAEMKTKLGIGGKTTTILVVGGVVLLLLIVLAATQVPPQPDFDD